MSEGADEVSGYEVGRGPDYLRAELKEPASGLRGTSKGASGTQDLAERGHCSVVGQSGNEVCSEPVYLRAELKGPASGLQGTSKGASGTQDLDERSHCSVVGRQREESGAARPQIACVDAAWEVGPQSETPQPETLLLAEQLRQVSLWLADDSPAIEEFVQLALAARHAGDVRLGEDSALEWAEGFTWPAEQIQRDAADFRACDNSLEQLATKRLQELGADRFTIDRADGALSTQNPHRAAVLDVAGGVVIPVDLEFWPNSVQGGD